jgi:ankyrin repeat protein
MRKGHLEVARLLIDRGADTEKAGKYTSTPAAPHAERVFLEAVRLLLDRGAGDANKEKQNNINGHNPLHLACGNGHLGGSNGHLEVARCLLDHGADKEKASKDGNTPLHDACREGHLDVARLLLDCGVDKDVNVADEEGSTPLQNACYKGHVEVARLLLDRGADVGEGVQQ